MADIKRTHSLQEREVADFPEVKNKIVDGIELSSDPDYFGITISFQDNTTFTLIIEPCVATFPVLTRWENGEEKTIKKYKSVRSIVPRT
ncbi:MAG: hypothetical protein DMG65_13660 [Candidatus Angelobacter sp. Gp1-AA117]|nr:MAG: hypothetical protein DMG65_13660 [Candidatus Angelobacter sp. Gp1-AA117]